MCEPLIAKSHFSASFEKAGGCPTPEEWASNKEALQSVLLWFWDARTTYPQNVKNASCGQLLFQESIRVRVRVRARVCVCVCVEVHVYACKHACMQASMHAWM